MSQKIKKKRNAFQWVVRVLTGYELTISCLVLLIAIVFFSTLEQAEVGLYTVKQRYYAIDVFFVQPELKGNLLPIVLPGAYWVCVAFTLNLISGGIIKMVYLFSKKARAEFSFDRLFGKFVGVLTSHISMAVLMISGAVDYHMSATTMLEVKETQVNRIGNSAEDIVIEVSEIVNGVEKNIHVIENDQINDMILNGKDSFFTRRAGERVFTFDQFPFKIKFNGWYRNADVLTQKSSRKPDDGEVVDGLFLREDDVLTEPEGERIQRYNQSVDVNKRKKSFNIGACYIEIVDEQESSHKTVLSTGFTEFSSSYTDPVEINIGGKTYGFKLTHKKTILPFDVALKELEVNTYQGTSMARDYISHIEYLSDGQQVSATISMNQPLRKDGYTVYQARWQSGKVALEERKKYVAALKAKGEKLNIPQDMRLTSVYQVVTNPADKWPEYCIYVCGIALLFHFGMKLVMFMLSSFKRKEKNEL